MLDGHGALQNVSYSCVQIKGQKEEDRWSALLSHANPKDGGLKNLASFGVFDGHSSRRAAEVLSEHLNSRVVLTFAELLVTAGLPNTLSMQPNNLVASTTDSVAAREGTSNKDSDFLTERGVSAHSISLHGGSDPSRSLDNSTTDRGKPVFPRGADTLFQPAVPDVTAEDTDEEEFVRDMASWSTTRGARTNSNEDYSDESIGLSLDDSSGGGTTEPNKSTLAKPAPIPIPIPIHSKLGSSSSSSSSVGSGGARTAMMGMGLSSSPSPSMSNLAKAARSAGYVPPNKDPLDVSMGKESVVSRNSNLSVSTSATDDTEVPSFSDNNACVTVVKSAYFTALKAGKEKAIAGTERAGAGAADGRSPSPFGANLQDGSPRDSSKSALAALKESVKQASRQLYVSELHDALMVEALVKETYELDKKIRSVSSSGSTSVTLHLRRQADGSMRALCANVGDSRCVMIAGCHSIVEKEKSGRSTKSDKAVAAATVSPADVKPNTYYSDLLKASRIASSPSVDDLSSTPVDSSAGSLRSTSGNGLLPAYIVANRTMISTAFLMSEDHNLTLPRERRRILSRTLPPWSTLPVECFEPYLPADLRSGLLMAQDIPISIFEVGALIAKMATPQNSGIQPAFESCGFGVGGDSLFSPIFQPVKSPSLSSRSTTTGSSSASTQSEDTKQRSMSSSSAGSRNLYLSSMDERDFEVVREIKRQHKSLDSLNRSGHGTPNSSSHGSVSGSGSGLFTRGFGSISSANLAAMSRLPIDTSTASVLRARARSCTSRYLETASSRLHLASRLIRKMRLLMQRAGNISKWSALADLQMAASIADLQLIADIYEKKEDFSKSTKDLMGSSGNSISVSGNGNGNGKDGRKGSSTGGTIELIHDCSFIARRASADGKTLGPEALFGRQGVSIMMTRSVGDVSGPRSCISFPETSGITIPPGQHARFVLASDGMWDVVSVGTVRLSALLSEYKNAHTFATYLANKAVRRRLRGGMRQDDVTVLVVDINIDCFVATDKEGLSRDDLKCFPDGHVESASGGACTIA